MTDYYDVSGDPATSSFGDSAVIRAELSAIQTGISEKLPALTGNGNNHVVVNSAGTALTSVTTAALAALVALSGFSIADAATNSVTNVADFLHTTTATPATGIGSSISLTTETTAGNHTGLVLSSVSTDVTSGSEDFDLVVNLMAAGATAAEKFRVTSAGVASATQFTATTLTGTLSTAAQPNITSLGTLTTLTVDNITVNGAVITSDTGAISFSDENLTTTGTLAAGTTTLSGGLVLSGTSSSSASAVNISTGGASDAMYFNVPTNGDIYFASNNSALVRFDPQNSRNLILQNTIIGSTSVSPDGTLHVYSGSAGTVTAHSFGDDLVIENSSDCGLSILAPTANLTSIMMGSDTSNLGYQLSWSHSSKVANYQTYGVGAVSIFYADNAVTNLTLSGASGSELATFAGDITQSHSDAGGSGVVHTIANTSTATNSYSVLSMSGNNGTVTGGVLMDGLGGTVSGGGVALRTTSSHNLLLQTAATTALTIDTSQNAVFNESIGVGISPQRLLHLYNTTEATSWAQSTTGIALHRTTNTSGDFYFGIDNSSGSGFSLGNYSRLLYSTGAYPIIFATNATTALTLDSSQNATFAGEVSLSGSAIIASVGTGTAELNLDNNDTGGRQYALGSTGTGSGEGTGKFIIYDVTGGANRFYIDASGDAGFSGDLTLSEGKVSITDTANESVLNITSSATTAQGSVNVVSNSLTSGSAGYFYSDSASFAGSGLVRVILDNTSATGTAFLVQNDGSGNSFVLDNNGNVVAMSIDSEATSERVIVANAPTSSQIMLLENAHATTPLGMLINFTGSSPDDNTQYFLQCGDTTTTRCRILSDGDLQNHDNSYGALSDERLKTNIIDARSYWDDFKAVSHKKYQFLTDIEQYGEDAQYQLGVVAQELELVFPGLIKTDQDGMKGVKYSILHGPIMACVVQELQERVESLEAANDPQLYADVIIRLDDHEARIEALEKELAELKAA